MKNCKRLSGKSNASDRTNLGRVRPPLIVSTILYCVDCKTVGFFLKISKEIGKVWLKSLHTQKYGLFCSLFAVKLKFTILVFIFRTAVS